MIILFGFILNVISVQIVASSFRHLQGALGASVDQISYVMSASLIAEVVIIPFSGWLARLVSPRKLYLFCLSGFLLSSIGCASTSNFYVMVVFRALQGLTGGGLMPLMMSSLYLLFNARQIPIALSVMATLGVSSIALGPLLGGWMTETLSWHWMFLYNIPIGIILLVLAYYFVDLKDHDKSLLKRIDFLGISFLACGLLLLLITLEEGSRMDWFKSPLITSSFILTITSFAFFFVREITTKYPVINLKVFIDRNFSIGCINVIIFGITLYVPIFLLPLFLGEIQNLGPLEIGAIVSVMGLSWMATGPIVGLLINKIGGKILIFLGCILIGVGTYLQTQITFEYGFDELFWPQICRGIGAQLFWVGNQYLSMLWVPREGVQNAAAMFNLVLRLGGAVSISMANTFLERLQVGFYGHIANSLLSSRQSLINAESNILGKNNSDIDIGTYSVAKIAFDGFGERESFIMALNSITFISMWAVLIPIILLPFCIVSKNVKN